MCSSDLDYYAPQAEGALRWDDPAIGIVWPDVGMAPQLSAKDAMAGSLDDVRRAQEATP